MFAKLQRYIGTRRKQNSLNKFQKKKEKATAVIRDSVLKCGEQLEVFGNVKIIAGERVIIGERCKLNDDVYINARSGLEIGNDVTISYGAKIISTGYDLECWVKTGVKKHFEDQPIFVGNYCWIGAGAIILPGVNITGEYVVIAAGAVVTRDVTESRVVLAGSPAVIVKKLGES